MAGRAATGHEQFLAVGGIALGVGSVSGGRGQQGGQCEQAEPFDAIELGLGALWT
jgi:hypothetical protein